MRIKPIKVNDRIIKNTKQAQAMLNASEGMTTANPQQAKEIAAKIIKAMDDNESDEEADPVDPVDQAFTQAFMSGYGMLGPEFKLQLDNPNSKKMTLRRKKVQSPELTKDMTKDLLSVGEVIKEMELKSNDRISVISQDHRFILGGVYKHLNFKIDCSLDIIDQSLFDVDNLVMIYDEVIKYTIKFFQIIDLDARPISRMDVEEIKTRLDQWIFDYVSEYRDRWYSDITIDNVMIWDTGPYVHSQSFE
jgi:hypothetical protein